MHSILKCYPKRLYMEKNNNSCRTTPVIKNSYVGQDIRVDIICRGPVCNRVGNTSTIRLCNSTSLII